MQSLTTPLLCKACRIFLTQAYPEGPESIPKAKRFYFDLPVDQDVAAFLPPAACAAGICQELRRPDGQPHGYALRLGSTAFPHLKLLLQRIDHNGEEVWVCMVDTHDAFSRQSRVPPPDHPEAVRWLELQSNNRNLKQAIETAFEEHGLMTLNSLLREGLQVPAH